MPVLRDLIRGVRSPRYASKVLLHRMVIAKGMTYVPYHPRALNIETTNRCNLHCVMCHREHGARAMIEASNGFLSMETFHKIVPFFRGVQHLNLSGFGETFLHRGFFDMLAIARRYPARISVYSNGTVTTERVARRIVELGLDAITNSIDGATRSVYRRIRGHDLDRLVDNLRTLKRVKEELVSDRPRVTLQMVAMRDNIEDLPALVDLASDVGAEAVSLVQMSVHAEHLREQSLYLHRELAERMFAEARRKAVALGIRLDLPSFEDHARGLQCFFTDLFITWDGLVLSCALERHVLGDLKTQTLREIWNGARLRELRRRFHEDGGMCGVCRGCFYNEHRRENFLDPPELSETRRRPDALERGCA